MLKISDLSKTNSHQGREYLTELMNKKISKALSTVPEEGEFLEDYHSNIGRLSKSERNNILSYMKKNTKELVNLSLASCNLAALQYGELISYFPTFWSPTQGHSENNKDNNKKGFASMVLRMDLFDSQEDHARLFIEASKLSTTGMENEERIATFGAMYGSKGYDWFKYQKSKSWEEVENNFLRNW